MRQYTLIWTENANNVMFYLGTTIKSLAGFYLGKAFYISGNNKLQLEFAELAFHLSYRITQVVQRIAGLLQGFLHIAKQEF